MRSQQNSENVSIPHSPPRWMACGFGCSETLRGWEDLDPEIVNPAGPKFRRVWVCGDVRQSVE